MAEPSAPVTGHKITLLEHTDFQYMLRGPVGVSAKYYLAGTETIPLTPVPKSGPDHAVSRHRVTNIYILPCSRY